MSDQCEWDGCEELATSLVKSISGTERFCKKHAWLVRWNEAEWGQAESELYD